MGGPYSGREATSRKQKHSQAIQEVSMVCYAKLRGRRADRDFTSNTRFTPVKPEEVKSENQQLKVKSSPSHPSNPHQEHSAERYITLD